jgi:hypothetical protein
VEEKQVEIKKMTDAAACVIAGSRMEGREMLTESSVRPSVRVSTCRVSVASWNDLSGCIAQACSVLRSVLTSGSFR